MKIFEYAAKTDGELIQRNLRQLDLWKTLAQRLKIAEDTPEYLDGFRKFAKLFDLYKEEYKIDMDEISIKNGYIFKKIKEMVLK
jgi:hypothetical protein